MTTNISSRARRIAALGALLALAGCSQAPVTAPLAPGVAPPGVVAPPPPSRLTVPANLAGAATASDSTQAALDWQLVTSVIVVPDADAVVNGSRYSLHFSKGSLTDLETITIKQYDPNVIDVQFGPHGTKFGTPVELSIDFSGTRCDPRVPYADQSEPVLYYLNEVTNEWEVVPGTTDWVHLKYIVRLEHFSRYVLGGKAGWKHGPPKTDD